MTFRLTLLLAAGSAALLLGNGATAQDASSVDFGDDSSLWSNDGECDDPRFEGPVMAAPLNAIDIMADASDCEALFIAGDITLAADETSDDDVTVDIDEPASAETPVGSEESAPPADAADTSPVTKTSSEIDFGDNESQFADDGECDDARFIGAGLTQTGLLQSDISHDANDCRVAFEAGTLRLRTSGDPSAESLVGGSSSLTDDMIEAAGEPSKADADPQSYSPPENSIMFNGVEFGDDQSRWSGDGECDDPRFQGDGMTATPLLEKDALHDASDCLAAWKTGGLKLK